MCIRDRLTAVIIFDTKEECAVRFTVKGKTEAADISGEVEAAVSHRIPVIGLYPAMENTVVLELLDKSGKVTDSQEITITTDELPDKLDDAVKPVKTSGESAFEPVSYTHLDVYKRQACFNCWISSEDHPSSAAISAAYSATR